MSRLFDKVLSNLDDEGRFKNDMLYWFPINEAEGDGSVTYLRCRLQAGEYPDGAYKEIREILQTMGCTPEVVAAGLDLPEIMWGADGTTEIN